MEKKLDKNDYDRVYSSAVRSFTEKSLGYKESGDHFLTRCIIDSFLSLTATNKLEIRNGKIYDASTTKET